MNQRVVQKATSREAIVTSAAALLREGGFAGTSVQAAMAGAGLTVGGFYAHFADKSSLCDAAFAVAMGEALDLVSEAASGRTGMASVEAVLAAYLSEGHRDDPAMGCPLPAVAGEGAVRQNASPVAIATGVSAMRDRLTELTGAAPDEALALVALMVGGQVLARALNGERTSDEVLAACRESGARLVGRLGDGSAQ